MLKSLSFSTGKVWAAVLRLLPFLFLCSAAPLFAASYACVNNAGVDPGAIQSAVNAGGTATITGSCNLGSTAVINVNNGVTITGGATFTSTNTNSAFSVNSNNVLFSGVNFNGAAVHSTGSTTAKRTALNFDNDTFSNYTLSNGPCCAIQVDSIWVNSYVTNSTFTNSWEGGYSSTLNPTAVPGGHLFIADSSGLDNVRIEYNSFSESSYDAMHLIENGLEDPTNGYCGGPLSISYNTFTLIHRMGVELQGQTSWGSSAKLWCGSGSDVTPNTSIKLNGNLYHSPAYPGESGANTYGLSVAINSISAQVSNNTILADYGATPLSSVRLGYAVEMMPGYGCGSCGGGVQGTYQGNVIGGDHRSSSPSGWYAIFKEYDNPNHQNTIQNNLQCGDPANTNSPGSDSNYIWTYNYLASGACPSGTGSAMYASTLASNPPVWTSANNQSFANGGNGTFSLYISAVSLSMRYVNFYIDGSTTPTVTQELQDLNSNFSTDRKWLYHAQINTSSLSAGTHTIKATATDVSGATSSVTQTFTVGNTSGPSAVLSTSSLAWPITGAQTVTLTNGGNTSLTLSGNTVSGTNASDFAFTTTCGSSLGAGSNCTFTVSFNPSGAAGSSESAQLNIANNSPSNPVVVSLSGTVPVYTAATVPSGGSTSGPSAGLQPTAAITVSAWINGSSQTNYPAFLDYGGSDSASPYESWILQAATIDGNSPADIWLLTGTGTINHLFGTTKLVAGVQYLVTSTYDGSSLKLYLNGVLQSSSAASGSIYYYGTNGVGAARKYSTTAANFSGTEAGATIWNTALSASQIAYLYAQGVPKVTPPVNGTINCNPSNCVAPPGGSVVLTYSSSVSWSLLPGSIGTLSKTTGTTTTYTAPATLTQAQHQSGSCMILPNDSVYNTRIDAFPVHANSANWLAAWSGYSFTLGPGWGINVIDNSVPTIAPQWYYTTAYNTTPFQLYQSPTRIRENGAFTSESGGDHHLVSVNHQTCQFYESYQDHDPIQGISLGITAGGGCNQGTGQFTGCDGSSGVQYNGTMEQQIPSNTTTAGNLLIAPTTLQAYEIRAGSIKHALRFTTNNAGCANTAIWPAVGSIGGYGCGTASAIPSGGRVRLKSSYTCPANAGAAAICNALKQYGLFWDDIGSGGPNITIAADVYSDPYSLAAIQALGPISVSNFEGVDESSLQLSNSTVLYAVNPNNGHVTPSNSAVVSVNSGATYVPITLQPVTVGVQDHFAAMAAGQTWTPAAYVTGTSNQTINWTASGGGSVSNGVYTAPAVAPGAKTAVTLTGCAAADASACDKIYLDVYPSGCQSSDTSIRICIDTGSASSYGPDVHGDYWSPDTTLNGGYSYNGWFSDDTLWHTTGADWQLFETLQNDVADIDYKFVGLPAGNYKVTFSQGVGYNGGGGQPCYVYGGWPSTYGPRPVGQGPGPTYLSTQDNLLIAGFDPGLPPVSNGYNCYTRSSYSVPAMVASDGVLTFGMAATGNDAVNGNYQWSTLISTIQVESDPTAPYMAIWLNGSDDIVRARGTKPMSIVWWYLDPSTVTWSVLSGPGAVSSTGVYTAPTTAPALTTPVVIQAADTDGNTATQTLYLQGNATPAAVY